MAKNGNIHPTRLFKEPKDLEDAWSKHKQELNIESLKWLKIQYVGKDGERKEDPQKIPLTLDGFEVYCYEHHGYVGQYFDNRDGIYEDFVAICSRIRKECRADQITGGMLGFYNPSITQRLNSLVDKQETEIKGGLNIPNLPDIGNRK
jgi:hypothetical protein